MSGCEASSSNSAQSTSIIQLNDSLFQLYKPPGAPNAQILFFHGLQLGDYSDAHVSTWNSADNSCVWPQKWLAEDFPDASILTVSYSAAAVCSELKIDMKIVGENLVSDLMNSNVGQTPDCPVILVGHSLGGVVIKQLCCQAHDTLNRSRRSARVKLEKFLNSIGGVFFYATPHWGSEFAQKLANNLSSPLQTFFKVLSRKAARLNQDFDDIRKLHDKWSFANAGETLPSKVPAILGLSESVLIVSEASARGDNFNLIENVDHFTICKPKGKGNRNFYKLKDFISGIMEDMTVLPGPENMTEAQSRPDGTAGGSGQHFEAHNVFSNKLPTNATGNPARAATEFVHMRTESKGKAEAGGRENDGRRASSRVGKEDSKGMYTEDISQVDSASRVHGGGGFDVMKSNSLFKEDHVATFSFGTPAVGSSARAFPRKVVNPAVPLPPELKKTTNTYRNPTQPDLPEVKENVAEQRTSTGLGSLHFNVASVRNQYFANIPAKNPLLLDLETSTQGIYRVYNRHMLVDRKTDVSDEPGSRMMDRIRHRLDPFTSSSSMLADVSQMKITNATSKSSPFGILVQLLRSSDLLVQTALFQSLLDGRVAVPLVVPSKAQAGEKGYVAHLAEALDFVRIKLANREFLSIAEDTLLPRVVFLSNRKSYQETSRLASKVMKLQFPSKFFKGDTGEEIAVVELGVGYLQISEHAAGDHNPCLVFCVLGDHTCVGGFLANVADIFIVEVNPSEEARSPSCVAGLPKNQVLYWKIDPSGEGYKDEPNWTFWGSFEKIAEVIEGYLLHGIIHGNEKLFKGASKGAASLEQCLSNMPPFNRNTPVFDANLDCIDLEEAKESLQLQKSFAKDVRLFHESPLYGPGKLQNDLWRRELQNERMTLAPKIHELALLQSFIAILSLEHYVERSIGIGKLEVQIEKKMHLSLKRASEREAQAFEAARHNERNIQLREKYILARREHADKKLGLEHLWRELSHVFAAQPHLSYLPQLAAQHLIDGFPLEIVDGDAVQLNELWVYSVLSELDMELSASLKQKPKVFVLSVLALEDSGKSTLLNVMFGTKVGTRQRSRGVYVQLIKSERKEFDYVLILESLGVRSPEYCLEQSDAAKDQFLVNCAFLPADACINMVADGHGNGPKDVRHLVMAFPDVQLAAVKANTTRFFFVCRSVDTSKLGRKQSKLEKEMREFQPLNSLYGLRFSSNDEESDEESDVKDLGDLEPGHVPAGDSPGSAYGAKVERFREYIHNRVTEDGQWKSTELQSWIFRMRNMWVPWSYHSLHSALISVNMSNWMGGGR